MLVIEVSGVRNSWETAETKSVWSRATASSLWTARQTTYPPAGTRITRAARLHPSSRRLNDAVGSWLCSYPIWSDLHAYRPYHLQHHARTSTADDPDLGLVLPFPITSASLLRKVWRDLSGRTGLKFARAAWARSPRSSTYSRRSGFRSMCRIRRRAAC